MDLSFTNIEYCILIIPIHKEFQLDVAASDVAWDYSAPGGRLAAPPPPPPPAAPAGSLGAQGEAAPRAAVAARVLQRPRADGSSSGWTCTSGMV